MNQHEYGHLDRGAFHAGIVALRAELRRYVGLQQGLKVILHKPHTSGIWKQQIALRRNRCEITAMLNVYAHVRGKASAHNAEKFDAAGYLNDRHRAQNVFDNAVEAHPVAEVAEVAVAE